MKKKLKLGLAIVMVLSILSACSSGSKDISDKGSASETTQTSPTASETSKQPEEGDLAFSTPVKITLALSGPGDLGISVVNHYFMDIVTERSGGAITFNYLPDGVLGNDSDGLNQILDGTLDMAMITMGTIGPFTELLDVFQMPFLIDSYEKEWKVLHSDEWKALIDGANQALGTGTIFGYVENGLRHFATADKSITTVEDMKGLKLRTGGNTIENRAIELMGASPVFIPFADLYSSLQNKVVDGESANYFLVYIQGHYEVIKNICEVNMYPFLNYYVIGNAFRDSLPEGYYEFLSLCMEDAMDQFFNKGGLAEMEALSKQTCDDNGIAVTQLEDREKLREICAPLYDEYSDKDVRIDNFIKYVQSLD